LRSSIRAWRRSNTTFLLLREQAGNIMTRMRYWFTGALGVATVACVCACGSSTSQTSTGPTAGTPTAQATVTSVTISGTQFSIAGAASQLTAAAHLSNGSTQDATNLATWQSSSVNVAIVSNTGRLTSVAGGTATITASYLGQTGSLSLIVSPVPAGGAKVRVLYAIPQDRAYRADYVAAVQSAMLDLQAWYLQQLSGRTFTLFKIAPETCTLPHPAAYYPGGTFSKVIADLQGCVPVTIGSSSTSWVVHADVEDGCNDPGRLGVGAFGLTIMGSQDLHGLVGERVIDGCGVEYRQPIGRYIGGTGHELGHTLGLSHPPGCDAGLPSCDTQALMWSGYSLYPNTYLRDDDKQILMMSPFIR
jgi:hypothetical protein